jgi:mRNA-degrading endonuclease toxin of MazEF toxin-antitoxin module
VNRGEIWFTKLPTDPPEKGARPVIVVSQDVRNRHPKADSVLVIPLTTTIHKEWATHMLLSPGETGLQEASVARAENITVVHKRTMVQPRYGLRSLSDTRICQLATMVAIAMDCA